MANVEEDTNSFDIIRKYWLVISIETLMPAAKLPNHLRTMMYNSERVANP